MVAHHADDQAEDDQRDRAVRVTQRARTHGDRCDGERHGREEAEIAATRAMSPSIDGTRVRFPLTSMLKSFRSTVSTLSTISFIE